MHKKSMEWWSRKCSAPELRLRRKEPQSGSETYIDEFLLAFALSPASLVLEDHIVIPPAISTSRQ